MGESANENYARELLQIFTIGLTQLNMDGSPKRDAAGNLIPAYRQADVLALARVFTGWTYTPRPGEYPGSIRPYYSGPMAASEPYHDTASKALFGSATLAAGQTAGQDLDARCRPSLSIPTLPRFWRGLIQQFVTSNLRRATSSVSPASSPTTAPASAATSRPSFARC